LRECHFLAVLCYLANSYLLDAFLEMPHGELLAGVNPAVGPVN
jgi:hypothetical protein